MRNIIKNQGRFYSLSNMGYFYMCEGFNSIIGIIFMSPGVT